MIEKIFIIFLHPSMFSRILSVIWSFIFTVMKLFKKQQSKCESVNFHFSRECNYRCKFCFHTNKTTTILSLDQAKRGLRLLKEAGMKKINFAGGEPFLHKDYLNELIKYCKIDLKVESVSIISNGSLIDEEWFQQISQYVDILGISCDSFNRENLQKMGRVDFRKGHDHLSNIKKIAFWCRSYKVPLKINTVVTSVNCEEDMNAEINELHPFRWKVFQCLLIEGENWGPNAKYGFKELEENKLSTLIEQSGFDKKAYEKRGGRFKWKRSIIKEHLEF